MKKHGKKRFYHIFNLLLVLLTIITLFMIYNTNILNITYFTVIIIILILVNLAIIGGINHKNIFALLLGIIIFVLEGIVNFYLFKTNNFLDKINNKTEIEVYRVVTLTSAAKDLEDIGNIGILTNGDDGYKKAVDNITDTIPNTTAFTDTSALTVALLAEKIPAILLDASTDVVLRENDEAYNASTKYIYEYEVKIKTNVNASSKNILKETFSIYISGVDTYNKIATKTRSDVNIVLTVNPVTKKIVMTHIPRDYYVTLAGINSKDKLTHASLYGIDTAMKTVEDLLDTKIDYYVRLNFTSLVKIVDLLGGLDVNSKYSFETGIYDDKMTKTYKFKQGLNHLDGDMALAFVRERHSFANGDITRGENQMIVLTALINKVISPKILTNYTKLLDSLDDAMITNMTKKEITDYIKKEISKPSSYDITSVSLNGTSAKEYTYSYKANKLYVMVPNEEDISNYKTIVGALYAN